MWIEIEHHHTKNCRSLSHRKSQCTNQRTFPSSPSHKRNRRRTTMTTLVSGSPHFRMLRSQKRWRRRSTLCYPYCLSRFELQPIKTRKLKSNAARFEKILSCLIASKLLQTSECGILADKTRTDVFVKCLPSSLESDALTKGSIQ